MKHNQHGLTFISIVFILALIGSLVLLTLKILPIYLNHFKVESSLESLAEESGLTEKPNQKIVQLLMNRLSINSTENVTKEDISVTRRPGFVRVDVNYEVTRNIAGNLDVLVYFDESIEVGNP